MRKKPLAKAKPWEGRSRSQPDERPVNADKPKPRRKPLVARKGGTGRGSVGEAEAAAAAGEILEPMRIAKAMARAGLCSRRDAERWIGEGRVKVNGKTLSSPALEVSPGDRIEVDGKPLPVQEPPRLWRYYKPKGLVTTHKDPEGRPTVFEKLPPEMGRVISIGRLDVSSEGLLLLTNDGALARHIELPQTGWLRRYRVRAHGRVSQGALDKLKDGITVDGVEYGPIEASLDKQQGANAWLTVGLREGKNREVRRVLADLGLDVNRLIRVSYGPFQLLDLAPGGVEVVRRRVLAEQLGAAIARELGMPETRNAGRLPRAETAGDDAQPGRKPVRGFKRKTGGQDERNAPKPKPGARSPAGGKRTKGRPRDKAAT
ncbi:MAG: pseudouridine synthase [Hyphomicrobiaceae bacterium]